MSAARGVIWNKTYEITYRAWYGEVLYADLLTVSKRFDGAVGVANTITSGGAAVAGWTLWTEPHAKVFWALLAGGATLISLAHTKVGFPRWLEDIERSWEALLQLRLAGKALLDKIDLDASDEEVKQGFTSLDPMIEAAEKASKPGMFRPSKRRRVAAQEQVDYHMRTYMAAKRDRADLTKEIAHG